MFPPLDNHDVLFALITAAALVVLVFVAACMKPNPPVGPLASNRCTQTASYSDLFSIYTILILCSPERLPQHGRPYFQAPHRDAAAHLRIRPTRGSTRARLHMQGLSELSHPSRHRSLPHQVLPPWEHTTTGCIQRLYGALGLASRP